MARYTSDSKERVRDAIDMVDLLPPPPGRRGAGPSRMTGLCPFHDERTPSFGINPVEKVYYCFCCQAQGDAFTFVMETEGCAFKGGLELLADPATFYGRQLWESREAELARGYLAERGLEEPTLREFRVGYAPSAWD